MIKSMKYSLKTSFLLLFIFLLIGCKKNADLIIYNANIYTVDKNFNIAKAIVIKDGKFLEVGENELQNKYNSEKSIDLKGSTVLPGLIDAHCHFYGLGTNQLVIDLVDTKSFEEIIYRLKSNSTKKKYYN